MKRRAIPKGSRTKGSGTKGSGSRPYRPTTSRPRAAVAVVALLGTAIAIAFLAGRGGGSATRIGSRSGAAPLSEPGGPSGACHVRGIGIHVLPDPTCTPGVLNPAVTQADLDSTVCSAGWAASVRPPESYTGPLKRSQMAAYGEGQSMRLYEEDHLISLELGGSPTDPGNLWPEPGASPNPKDQVENVARRAVCDGSLSLAEAQRSIAADWMAFGRRLGVLTTGAGR